MKIKCLREDHFWALRLKFGLKQCLRCWRIAECDE